LFNENMLSLGEVPPSDPVSGKRTRSGKVVITLCGLRAHGEPKDMLAGRQRKIHAERDRKLDVGRNSGRFAGYRLRNVLWGHSTRSPFLALAKGF
jgi:hypothetical protein